MKTTATLTLYVLLWAGFTPFSLSGATHHVSTSGNDSNPGTLSQPWKTIQHAADVSVAGDIVYIHGGVYSEQVTIENGGNANNGHLVFSGFEDEEAIIDGTGVGTGNNGLIIQASYVKILKLTVRNWADTDIWVQGPAGFIEISECKAYNALGCISFTNGVHDFVLSKNEMYNFGFYGFDATSESGFPDSYNGTISDCYAHDGDPGQNCDGFALGHSANRNITFNRCIVSRTFDGFDITGHKIYLNRCCANDCYWGGYKLWSDSIYLENCMAFGCNVTNLELDGGEDQNPDPLYAPKKIVLRNCTFFDAEVWNILVPGSSGNDSLEMYNCIIAGGDNIGLGFGEDDFSTYKGDYNVFHNDDPLRPISFPTDDISLSAIQAGDWANMSGQDIHSKTVASADALFIDIGIPDLHLLAGAIAIDNGTAAGSPAEDYDGCPRPYNDLFDIGADEYSPCVIGAEEIPASIEHNYLSQNFPNPCSETTLIKIVLPAGFASAGLCIFDVCGKEIAPRITSQKEEAGECEIELDVARLPVGLYFYGIRGKGFKKMTVFR